MTCYLVTAGKRSDGKEQLNPPAMDTGRCPDLVARIGFDMLVDGHRFHRRQKNKLIVRSSKVKQVDELESKVKSVCRLLQSMASQGQQCRNASAHNLESCYTELYQASVGLDQGHLFR